MTIKPTKSGLSGKSLTQHPQTRFVEKMGLFIGLSYQKQSSVFH